MTSVADPLISFPSIYLGAVLLACTWADTSRMIIPNAANGALLLGAAAFACVSPIHTLPSALLGGIIGAASFLALSLFFRHVRGRDGLGLGDVKFMAGAGTWVGWQGLAPLVLIASLSALVYVATLTLSNGSFDPDRKLPFAPFLSLATALVWSLQVTEAMPWGLPLP
jgi:leader peptidase (prepilin peptidase)/N-methyltransferase